MDLLFELLKLYNVKLEIIHISKDYENLLKEKQIFEKHGKSLNGLNYSFHVVYDNDIKHGIVGFLRKQSENMLAIIYRVHSFFKRLFDLGIRKKMNTEAEIPVRILITIS